MRVGFLFNHDQIHQIAHSLPIAIALLPHAEVVLAATSEKLANEIRRIGAAAGHPWLSPLRLGLSSRTSRLLEQGLGRALPARKLLVYRDNLEFFETLDALVVTERTSLMLKTRYGLSDLPIILADHGAGDRKIGFGREASRFDHILAAGPKIRDRLIGEAGVEPARITITGYPKFDLRRLAPATLPFAASGRPAVLYNPHVSPHLSSWFTQGRRVLDFFLASDRYNLIFAPHVMLFERRWALSIDRLRIARPRDLDRRYFQAPNIHIDLGSPASTDMSYTDAADIYLGDVSSQIYEFLRRPRPALFLNAHHVSYDGDPNYAHWRAGPVISDAAELESGLRAASEEHAPRYASVQRELFDYTFDVQDEPSSARGARAILDYLSRRGRSLPLPGSWRIA
ncbi:hypothetical protein HJG53_12575 [Sphingomonas sp. ID1715]|uniref:hypothetical protein n=1 Tax=Sphingomonas sp. ID1715 TaxID=1656898 RepID=UPI001488CE48|nr:hypothetical protein [Sphingomonas sp. ID1715]NNM77743.1 hypothetical protein [Sphingomonas sp. ID1715]